ncbi:hypothetical protein [Ktedonobacter racemifer]|uniref:Uncharacterized protein n=1 Tax=Ktedonobacter racemifer DSM 44963 TaxID=485913 RepID=D6TR18_KTERA|nr:hypothetical protein [Ktedonobacter racemifer]EFH85889.1 hypothetical protein Krac_7144 [Ktedonobacter racemifer DSM 44963]
MKSHTLAPITRASSLTEQLGIHDLSEQELEQVAGAQGYSPYHGNGRNDHDNGRNDHDNGRNDHDHDWYYGHRRGWDHDHHHRWDYKRGWCYTSGWLR